jgi:hypothetical protein
VIPYTTPTTLLARYGTDQKGRAKARKHIVSELRDGAQQLLTDSLRRAGRSLRCAQGDHGCANDGSGCLCECHDAAEPAGGAR